VLFLYRARNNSTPIFLIVPWLDLYGGLYVLHLGVTKPVSMDNLFVLGLEDFRASLVLIGMTTFCWALRIGRNDLMFQKSQYKSILQVIFRRDVLDQELVGPF
jgi:hypothetical protein